MINFNNVFIQLTPDIFTCIKHASFCRPTIADEALHATNVNGQIVSDGQIVSGTFAAF